MASGDKWTPLLMEIDSAIVTMGPFGHPLEPKLVGLTPRQWMIIRAERILKVIEDAIKEGRYEGYYDPGCAPRGGGTPSTNTPQTREEEGMELASQLQEVALLHGGRQLPMQTMVYLGE